MVLRKQLLHEELGIPHRQFYFPLYGFSDKWRVMTEKLAKAGHKLQLLGFNHPHRLGDAEAGFWAGSDRSNMFSYVIKRTEASPSGESGFERSFDWC